MGRGQWRLGPSAPQVHHLIFIWLWVSNKRSLGKGWENPEKLHGVLKTGSCLVSPFGAPSGSLQGWCFIPTGAKQPWSHRFSLAVARAQFGRALPGLADTHPGGCQPLTHPQHHLPGPQGCHLLWQAQEVACTLLEWGSLLVAQCRPLKGAWLLGDIPARTSASDCI